MAQAAAVRIQGLDEFVAELRAADGGWPRELGRVHRRIGTMVATEARVFAIGTGPEQAHFANKIEGRGDPRSATVGVRSIANAAFWGTLRRTGWYAAAKYEGGPRQHPAWIGQTWQVGRVGEGPLAINPAIAHELPRIERAYADAVGELYGRAFPN